MSLRISTIFDNPYTKDALVTALFGVLSIILGMVQFQTPGFEGSYSDLREIALLISLFHIYNPLFIIPLSIVTLIGLPEEVPYLPTFLMHVIPLIVAWFAFKWIERRKMSAIASGMSWFVVATLYYTLFLYTLLIITYQWAGLNNNQNFIASYQSILASGKFELIATALVSSLYLVQFEIRKSLEHTNKNLEEIVTKRTIELTSANSELQTLNEELIASNEEVKSLNENLERLIKERTEKINNQLNQLTKYAHMNSHEVRAPLARILGLLALIKKEEDTQQLTDLLEKIHISSEELDEVVKNMNRLLEKEIASHE